MCQYVTTLSNGSETMGITTPAYSAYIVQSFRSHLLSVCGQSAFMVRLSVCPWKNIIKMGILFRFCRYLKKRFDRDCLLAKLLTNPKSKSKLQVQVQIDDWVFFKLDFPTIHTQRLWNMFWHKPRPKSIYWESKRPEKLSIQDFFNHDKLSYIYKLEADII